MPHENAERASLRCRACASPPPHGAPLSTPFAAVFMERLARFNLPEGRMPLETSDANNGAVSRDGG